MTEGRLWRLGMGRQLLAVLVLIIKKMSYGSSHLISKEKYPCLALNCLAFCTSIRELSTTQTKPRPRLKSELLSSFMIILFTAN